MKAYELIDKPEKWTKGTYERDIDGNPYYSGSYKGPVCYCLLGALRNAYPEAYKEDSIEWDVIKGNIYKKLELSNGETIADWNDAPERTWSEVYSLLKELDI